MMIDRMRKFYLQAVMLLLLCSSALSQVPGVELVITGDEVVGEPLTVEVVAYWPGGIDEVRMLIDGDTENGQLIQACGGSKNCTLSTTITQDYIGSKTIWGSLTKFQNNGFERTSTILNFTCEQEYCPPDPTMNSFFQWMREQKYPECITSKYIQFSEDAEFRNGGRFLPSMKWFLNSRGVFEDTIITIDFIDVIPTDDGSTFRGLSEGEAEPCTPDPSWPELCPNPVSADYKYLEVHLQKTFGVRVVLNYVRKEINYSNVLGQPSLNSGRYQYPFAGRRAYIAQFPTNSIVHWALERLNDKPIYNMTGASHLAEVNYEPNITQGLIVTSHEWGHTLGQRNGSSVLPHPFQVRNGNRAYFQIDGVMSNTYRAGTGAQDPLDPMERYALEPPIGFLDDSTYVQEYIDGILGWPTGLNVCDSIDVAIKDLEIINQTNDTTTVRFTIENNNSRNTGFVNIGLVNEQQEIEEMRTIEFVYWGRPISMDWTIPNCNGPYSIVVDPLNKMVEKKKTNNVASFNCAFDATTNIDKTIDFYLYPNPASSEISIVSNRAGLEGLVSIYDVNGVILERRKMFEEIKINVSKYAEGLYFVKVKTDDQFVVKKFHRQ